jgi:hypothetical protein
MNKFLKALPVLAVVFAASCRERQADVTPENDKVDYNIVAKARNGDTLWSVVTDNLLVQGDAIGQSGKYPTSYIAEDEVVAFDKKTGVPSKASLGETGNTASATPVYRR